MRKRAVSVPVQKPRNAVVRALISRIRLGAGRHRHVQNKRKANIDDTDLAQRVREVGEW